MTSKVLKYAFFPFPTYFFERKEQISQPASDWPGEKTKKQNLAAATIVSHTELMAGESCQAKLRHVFQFKAAKGRGAVP